MERIPIFIALAALTFINVIIPISGSATTTPLLALITEPRVAIGLASFYFVLAGLIRVFVFRKHIRFQYVKSLLPISLVGAVLGASSLIKIDSRLLYLIILVFLIYFLIKKVLELFSNQGSDKTPHKQGLFLVGILSGFLQGFGLAGSDLRNGYLYSKNLSIPEVHGTTALIGSSNFLIATLIRVYTKQLKVVDISILVYLLPFMVVATYLGKIALLKLNKTTSNYLVIVIMFAMAILLFMKIVGIKV